jgi:ATP-binding cassette subfamily F protein 3
MCYFRGPMLTLNAITVRLGGHPILENASASIPDGGRVGLVGRNGAGKSTLLKVIAGELEADGGAVRMPRGYRLGYVAQDEPGGPASPFETVLAADTERAALLAESEGDADAARIAEIHERLNVIEAHAAPARAARILAGLGFDEEAQHRPLDSFSGGWRSRVALAAVLFSRPDVLLLDEPSNHLDLEASLWLESFLRGNPATLVVVSHERDLLNNVVDHILHLQGGRLALYPGGYDEFERLRRERESQTEALRAKQEARRQKLQAFVDRWRAKAHSARQAQSRLKAMARMEPIAESATDPTLVFDFPDPDALRPPLVALDNAAVGYVPGRPVLSGLRLRFDPDDRIAFLGRNGNGKTTLARLLSGRLAPMSGKVTASGKLRVGYFSQLQVDELDLDDTPLAHMTRLMPEASPAAVRAQLGRFGFSGDKVLLEVRKLSGGERARLALALITREAPHLLILDEPTNHLDVDAREALVQALNGFEGAVILVSHDRHLVELTADRLVLVDDGTAKEFPGSLADYTDMVLGRGERGGSSGDTKSAKTDKAERRRSAARAREQTRALRDAVKSAEKEIAELTRRRDELDAALADPSRRKNGLKPAEAMKRRGAVERDLATAEQRWVEVSEALEGSERAAAD